MEKAKQERTRRWHHSPTVVSPAFVSRSPSGESSTHPKPMARATAFFMSADAEKAGELDQRIGELEKQLGPEYLALVDALRNFDFDSKDGQEILSIFDRLDDSCPQ